MKTKWSKGGMKLVKSFGSWSSEEQSAVASFICPSLRECLKVFGKNIIYLKAKGSKQIPLMEDKLSNLGILINDQEKKYCVMKYKNDYKTKYKHDNLTSNNIKKINRFLDKNNIGDCAVETIQVELKDNYLKELIEEMYSINLKDNIFIVELNSIHTESDIDTKIWEDTPYNRDILAPLKFKRMVLHTTKLIDNGQLTGVTRLKRRYFINWRYKKGQELQSNNTSPLEIASSLIKLYEPYGYTKHYKQNSMNRLVLVGMK